MSSAFHRSLRERQPDAGDRRWIFVPYDQLTHSVGPLSRESPEEVGIVLVENPWKAARRPYHKQKLALVLANIRQFALEQAARGVAVRHIVASGPYRDALAEIVKECGTLRCMIPAERELRADLAPLVETGGIEYVPHEGWLTTTAQFEAAHGNGPPWRMDRFYRQVRRDLGILMEQGKPLGGKFSFDAENRKAWRGDPPAPRVPTFRPDAVTQEVLDLVASRFADHPGELDGRTLPASAKDAKKLWRWARRECLAQFGPYQDAMAAGSASLFHTRISALVHLQRLLPDQVVRDVLAMDDLSLASREGFVRQVLGWREFVRHVHDATDGFRRMPGKSGRRPKAACPSHFASATRSLPAAFWGDRPSGLNCLDRVVADVWREGYGHHITRLMVLANIATLLDVSPRELTDWFWVAYTDAYDWVVEPNVMGMGTFAVGDLMTTKPYIAGASYIDKMSDYCKRCAFNPRTTCPIRSLYWAFLGRHRDALTGNRRLAIPLASEKKRSAAQKQEDRQIFERVARALEAGLPLEP